MKKIFLFLVIFTLFNVLGLNLAQAQKNQETNQEEQEKPKIKAKILVNKKEGLLTDEFHFDASSTENPENLVLKYFWDFGDGQTVHGKKVMHIYESTGKYKVVLRVEGDTEKSVAEETINVYQDLIILIADKSVDEEKIKLLSRYAAKQNVQILIIQDKSSEPNYIVEGNLVNLLFKERERIKKTDIIISWTSGNIGLSALSKFIQVTEKPEEFDIRHKGIVSVIDGNLAAAARITQSVFDRMQPKYILLTKETALHAVIDAKTSENVLEEVRAAGVSHNLIGIHSGRAVKKLGLTNFMSYTVNYLINKGVSVENIVLMLMIPIIATIIAFARQFLGIKTLGIYTPTIITLSFLATGLKYGLIIFLSILIVATFVRLILKRFRLLYLPRMAIVLTVVALTILSMFVIGAITGKTGIIGLSILPVLVLIILVEKFIAIQIEKGASTAITLTVETILVSVVCYYIVNWDRLKTLILAYPEIILLSFLINILLAKWVGLRLSEYIRFREIRKFIKKE